MVSFIGSGWSAVARKSCFVPSSRYLPRSKAWNRKGSPCEPVAATPVAARVTSFPLATDRSAKHPLAGA
jgi:hypothetical protein